jgi:predicted nucleic acid-binding protein
MKYLLDTDTLIDFLQNRDDTRSQITSFIESGDEVALCAITLAELYSGLTEQRRLAWREWLSALPYWDISREAAIRSGVFRKEMAEDGRTFSLTDVVLAMVAREHDATLLTSNIKDYPMKNLRVLSLREEAA